MGLLKVTLVMSVGVAFLAYYTSPKFPESASNRGAKTFGGVIANIMDLLGYIGGLVGLSTINITRTLYDLQINDNPAADVQEYTTHMDGVEVVVFKPVGDTDQLRPGIIHIHGGGWAVMSAATYTPFIHELVRQTQSVVVSINYRLAPEYIFPIPFEDCLRVTHFFLRNTEKYGVDERLVAIKGDSAGGNLALAVSLNLSTDATNRPANELKLLSVDYGAIQAFDLNLPSYQKHEYGPGVLNKRRWMYYLINYAFGHQDFYDLFYANDHISQELKTSFYKDRVSWDYLPKHFVNEAQDTPSEVSSRLKDSEVTNAIKDLVTNPMFAPLMAPDEDLAKLPATYVMNAEFDILRDEGFILVERLKSVGVNVRQSYHQTEEHGFLGLVDEIARKEIFNFAEFFNKTMHL